jgi:Xaa-Pro aminopeptidase
MTGAEADAGFGDAFGHSLGHGLGLEVHEAPRLAATAKAPLPVGAVVTVEPGIYLPGWGGVRLEDDVWLSPDGPVLLTDGRKPEGRGRTWRIPRTSATAWCSPSRGGCCRWCISST